MRLYFAFSAILLFTAVSNAQKPELAWSARTAQDLASPTGTAVGLDGGVYFVGVTTSGLDVSKPNFRNSQILTGKLSPDGATACSATVGGSFDDFALGMAVFPDGTLLVAGITDSLDFPRVPAHSPTASDEPRSFVMRVNPCDGGIRYSTYLPAGWTASVVAIAADESVYVGAAKINGDNGGALFRLDPRGSSILAQTTLRGIPLALMLDGARGVFTTGMLPPVGPIGATKRLAFVSNHTQDLQRAVYDLTLGESSAMVGTVLFSDGQSLYVGGFGTRPGEVLYNFAYADRYVPSFQNGSAWLARIWPDGSVAFQSFVDIASLASFTAYRRPVGLGAGPDGRLWMAITGPTAFPRTMPQVVELDGVLLTSFNPDGTPAGGDTLVPGLRPYFPRPVVAFSPSGRIAELSLNPYLPPTAGASATGVLSAVVFELAEAAAAPEVIADREILDIDEVSLSGTTYLTRDPKAVGIKLSDGSHREFTAATVLDASRGFSSDPPPFSISGNSTGQLPASILVAGPQQSFNAAALMVLTPGVQGTVALPARFRQLTAGLIVRATDAWVLPAPSSNPVTFHLSVSAEVGSGASHLNLPFRITQQAPWLQLEVTEGVTPAILNAVVDPSGLATGTYPVTFTVEVGGGVIKSSLILTIGPVLRVSPQYGVIDVLAGQVRTVPLTIASSSTPLDFTLEPANAALDFSLQQGTTPQDVVATFNPSGVPLNQISYQSYVIRANGVQYLNSLQFRVSSFITSVDSPPTAASPGSLITFYAGKSQCDPVALTPAPWGTQLGGCTLRVNGRAIPLGSIEILQSLPANPDPGHMILAQLPYDLAGPATLEIQDKTGSKSAFPLAVNPVVPVSRDPQFITPTRRVGEEMVLRMTGLGVTVTPAPLGDVPTGSIVPVAPVEVYVGGRKARLLSVELSRSEVGTFEVRFEVPEIAPDLHNLSLSIGGTSFAVGTLLVTAALPQTDCTYGFSYGGQAFGPAGGNASVDIATSPGCAWTLSNIPSWVMPTSIRGTGSGTITYQIAANAGGARSAVFTVAGISFNIEQQAASIGGLNFVGSMAHLAGEENWTTMFTLVNKGVNTAQARLSLFGDALDPTGNGLLLLPLAFPLQGPALPLLAASFDRTLGGNASLIVNTAGAQTLPVLVGSAQLAATGSVDGFAIFHQVVTAQEAVVPMETRNASSYLLAFDNTNGLVLGVAVENVSAQNAVIPVIIRDDTGAVISAPGTTISLGGSGHTAFVLSDPNLGFPVTADKRGTIEFDTPAGGQISVLGLRFTPPNNALTTIPALSNVGTGGGSIAHLASGGDGWQTTFVLVNTGTSSTQATLSFFNDLTGAPLSLPLTFPQGNITDTTAPSVTQSMAAGATLVVVSSGAATLLTGSAQLHTTGHVSGFVMFRHNGQEAVVPLESRNADAYIVAFDNTNGTATGVAVNAVSTQQVNVPVIVRNETGTQIATDTIPLAPNGHYAFTLVTDKYPATANIRGTIEFTTPAGAQIGALGIRIPAVAAHTYTTLPALAK
jgi:hypothetical protein